MKYDIIIAGTGCAGLSFIYFLLKSSLKDKNILLIDQENPNPLDKTWCYWSDKPLELHPKDKVVSWKKIRVSKNHKNEPHSLKSLNYYHLKSSDFQKHIKDFLLDFPNVHYLVDQVTEISDLGDYCNVATKNNGSILGQKVVNSIPNLVEFNFKSNVRQIFTGWTISTEQNVFDKDSATLMEFNAVPNDHVNFIYILPYSANEALIEYTIFSEHDIETSLLEPSLDSYIKQQLKIDQFTILSKEHGVIPMTNTLKKIKNQKNIVNIGTAGGATKASTGYTFYNVQKQVKQIIQLLENNNDFDAYSPFTSKRFMFYDNIILNIIKKWPEKTPKIFVEMFAKNKPEMVLKFLNEETTLWEEINILKNLPLYICIKSLLNYEKY
jgi:lycopene beta-cyclase